MGSETRAARDDPPEELLEARQPGIDCLEPVDCDPTRIPAIPVSHFSREVSVFRLKDLSLGDTLDDNVDLTGRKSLRQTVIGAEAHGLNGGLQRGIAGHDGNQQR